MNNVQFLKHFGYRYLNYVLLSLVLKGGVHSMLIKCTYPETTSSSLLKALQQHTIQRRSPPKKNITRKLLFRVNTSLFCSTKWKGNSSLWPIVGLYYRCHYTKSNPIDDHSNISSKKLQKQNFKPLGHYTCMQCGTSHLQKVQENILSRIILATYMKFTVATVRFTQNVTGNIFTHPIYQQVANVTV